MSQANRIAITSLLTLLCICTGRANASYSILDYGAKPDGRTDSAKAILTAWAAACASKAPVTIYIPKGKFLVSQATLHGPCNNTGIKLFISGTLLAPGGYTSAADWIELKYVHGVSVFGGTLDGRGQAFWACKAAATRCPVGSSSLSIKESRDVLISGLTSYNSEEFHLSIFGSSGITVQGSRITAPGNSPNTDGIHIQKSSDVRIEATSIGTGDDCVSIGPGAANVLIQSLTCGPGHGISIGSLGGTPEEAGVQNITVTNVALSGTQNGLRIKTWGDIYTGFVKGVTFKNVAMQNVRNPIIMDQNYCPGHVNCPGKSSGIKISGVTYSEIHGSSASEIAVKFDCSARNPCVGIRLSGVKLTYHDQTAKSYCRNAHGSTSGSVSPPSCF